MREELARIRTEQRRALLRYMVDGGLEPRDVARRLSELEGGFAQGLQRNLIPLAELAPPSALFRPLRTRPAARLSRHFAGRPWQRRSLNDEAKAAVARGEIVTVFRFSPSALPHRVRFHEGGWWEQRGGLFGRAKRDEPWFRWQSFRSRIAREWQRVAWLRQCGTYDTKS